MKVGQTFLSAHVAEEALSAVSGTGRRQAEDASAQMCLLCFCLQDSRKDGRFFAALRMTCFAIAIAEMFRSYLRQTCHPEEAGLKVGRTFLSAHAWSASSQAEEISAQMCLLHFCLQDSRTDGRFFAALRMTCIAIAIAEMFRSYLRQTCHPEEAGLKVGQTFLSARMERQQSGRRNLRANVFTAFLPSGQSKRREILRLRSE